jgi:hypothetical protein
MWIFKFTTNSESDIVLIPYALRTICVAYKYQFFQSEFIYTFISSKKRALEFHNSQS